jgi:hypothetical protein
VRLDAHSIPFPDYVSRCVQDIHDGKGGNVGGKWIIRPGGTGWIAKGIAAAAGHPLGAGDAWYRIGGTARKVDTVPFGAFPRSLFESIGGFDEKLLTNEDYEFNARLRRAGVAIWFDPEIRSTYLARASLRELSRQYWRYGFWKVRMLTRFPGSLRWRQALPPLFVASLGLLLLLSAIWRVALIGLACEIALYGLALVAAGSDMARRGREGALLPGSMLALATMHLAWGSGFIWSLARAGRSEPNG